MGAFTELELKLEVQVLELDHPDLDLLVPHTPDDNCFLDRVGRSYDFKPDPFLGEIQRVPDVLLQKAKKYAQKTTTRNPKSGGTA